jgi:signal transduction histidine kinase
MSGAAPGASAAKPLRRTAVLVARVRGGLWVIVGLTAAMALSECTLRPGVVPLLDASQAYTIGTLLGALWLLHARPTQACAIAVGLLGLTVSCLAMARVGILSNDVPVQGYIALAMATAAMVPWGVRVQALAITVVGATYWWNVSAVPGRTAVLTSREVSSMVVLAAAALYITWVLDRHSRQEARERRHQHALRGELERRVSERTHALVAANTALTAEAHASHRLRDQLLVISDSFPGYLAYVGTDLRYVWVNQAYEKYWLLPRTEIVGKHMRELHDRSVFRDLQTHIDAALAGVQCTTEMSVPQAGAGSRSFEITFFPHREPNGTLAGFIIFGVETTARHASEARLHRTERLAALGTLAAGIAHEINNPAASILSTAEMVRATLDDFDRTLLDESLAAIAAEAQRCGQIVRSVLRFAREEPAERTPQLLFPVLQRATELLRGEVALAGATIHVDCTATPAPVAIVASEILQVVLNVTTNALRAGARTVTLRTAARPGTLALLVEDDGRGMTEAERARVFDPFFTTTRARGGTGLGLSVCHSILTQHGGTIELQSTVGVGTTVIIELPLPAATAETGPAAIASTGT